MATIRMSGVGPWDGDYPFDGDYFTNRELHFIKEQTGIRGGEITEALDSGDNDFLVVVALIAAKRLGKNIPPDDIWDAHAGKIEFLTEDDVLPPAQSATGKPPAAAAKPGSSGGSSSTTGDPAPSDLSLTGDRG